MTLFRRQVTVEYTAEQMFDLVNDITAYPRFIPLVSSVEILDLRDRQMRAVFKIAKGQLGFEFTTLNSFEKARFISMKLENGPFKHFKGSWRFSPLESDHCLIDLNMEFEFSNPLFSMVLNALFNQLCVSMMDAFRRQAAIVYKMSPKGVDSLQSVAPPSLKAK